MSLNIIPLAQVIEKTCLSRATIYAHVKSGVFPKQVKLSTRRVGWIESEVDAWLEQQIAKSR